MRFLHRLWINLCVLELDEIPFIGCQRLGPNSFHRFNIFIGAVTASFIRYAEHAEYQIEIEPNDSYPAADAVARGDADIGFHIGLEGTLPASCEYVGREKIAFYVGRDHPLATRNIVSAEDLSACPLIPLPRKDRLRDVVEAVMARLGVSGNPVALQTANAVLAQMNLPRG